MRNQPYLSLNLNAFNSGGRPATDKLIAAIRDQILATRFPSGCRLPPVRVLAHQLGISKTTVQRVYDELVAQGLAESKKRVGLFLTSPAEDSKQVPRKKAISPTLKDLPPLWGPRPGSRSAKTDKPIGLSGASIDPDLLPTEKFAACLRSVLKDRKSGMAVYPGPQGFLPLREKIAQRLNKRGIPGRAEDIVTTLGSQQCLDLVCRVLAKKKIATESPAYLVGKALFELSDVRQVGLPLNPFKGIDLEDWERRITRSEPGLLYLVPNFQNPTGYSYSTVEMNQIIDWSREYGFGILEDDWGSDMLSFSEFRPSLRARGGDGILYMNAFTKKLLPSVRLGYLVGNEKTVPMLVRSKHASVLGTPFILEVALFEFLDRGYYDVHLKQLHTELDRRYRHCLDVLRQTMPEGVKWTTPGGGPILWLEMPSRVSLHAMSARLAEKNVSFLICDKAFFGKPHLNGFPLCYSRLFPEELQRDIEVLAREIRTL